MFLPERGIIDRRESVGLIQGTSLEIAALGWL